MIEEKEATGPQGRLGHVLATREGHAQDPEKPMVIAHREALIYTLGKAAELEHLVMCQYLYAAFSLKEEAKEGVPEELLPKVVAWKRELIHIGEQEMLHLALVQNLLNSVGAAPRLGRPNFPLSPAAMPCDVQMALLPFGEPALRHFAYLERPEGMDMSDQEGFAAVAKARELPHDEADEIGPHLQDFDTVGHLYRSIEDGFASLAEQMGESRLFIGPARTQATPAHLEFDELTAVTDLVSARAAIDVIVEQGEGARGDWRDAHFGRLVRILDEYLAIQETHPDFEPARPVMLAHVRPLATGQDVELIGHGFTARCADLLNATYELILQLLARYFAHTDETSEQLSALTNVAVALMKFVVKPLGSLITRMPMGPDHSDRTAGPALELFYETDYLLPDRAAAWAIMEERMREIAELATRCRDECIPTFMPALSRITASLQAQAEVLAAAR
ncbi:MAG TPA: ferritin-like protein [Candidatus Limnocylindria bacterium]|nr:ferritin-like protein [Candidatus Limnocylindria bacterium]